MKDVLIIGAGISGLAAAWLIKEQYGQAANVTIIEASCRAGGWIKSERHNNFLFESGARSFRTSGHGLYTLKLIESLGLQAEIIAPSQEAKRHYIYLAEKLQPLPYSLFSCLFSPLTRSLLPIFIRECFIPPTFQGDESIGHFIRRRLHEKVALRLIDPLMTGIYAGDIDKLSMQACLPRFYEWEKTYGSIIKGWWHEQKLQRQEQASLSHFVRHMQTIPVVTFLEGMETLPKTLATKLSPSLRLACKATSVSMAGNKVIVDTTEGQLAADILLIAIPANEATKILSKSLKSPIEEEERASLAVVNAGWQKILNIPKGFGYLVPKSDKTPLLGTVFDSIAFPQQNFYNQETRLTAMLGGVHHPDILAFNDEEIKNIAMDSWNKHLNISLPPDAFHIFRAPQAIPQYSVGHIARIQAFEEHLRQASSKKIRLLGNSWHGVATNDCIATAHQICQELRPLLINLSNVPD